jgi:hypothetical protein
LTLLLFAAIVVEGRTPAYQAECEIPPSPPEIYVPLLQKYTLMDDGMLSRFAEDRCSRSRRQALVNDILHNVDPSHFGRHSGEKHELFVARHLER